MRAVRFDIRGDTTSAGKFGQICLSVARFAQYSPDDVVRGGMGLRDAVPRRGPWKWDNMRTKSILMLAFEHSPSIVVRNPVANPAELGRRARPQPGIGTLAAACVTGEAYRNFTEERTIRSDVCP
jgi:hypothetical protein